MHSAKLTLSIPRKILAEAKTYSTKSGQPLSRLVSRYFASLAALRKGKAPDISPKVEKITGLAKSRADDKTLLWGALARKYKL